MKKGCAFEASWRVLASAQVVLTDELRQIVSLLSERAYCHSLTAEGGGGGVCGVTSSSLHRINMVP